MLERSRFLLVLTAFLVLSCGRQGGESRQAPAAAPSPAPPAAAEADAPPAAGPAPIEAEAEAGAPFDARFGLALGPDGRVETPVLSFAAGDPVCLSVTLAAGAKGSRLGLRWFDVDDRPAGETTAALAGDPPRGAACLPGAAGLPRGTYRLEITADDRPLGSTAFAITDLRQTERAGGA